jgi:drug/metabolite transporter (DMT)-like permease
MLRICVPLLPVILAALSAAVWGTGDFCGGKASQNADPIAVTVLSQLLGIPVLVISVVIFSRGTPTLGMLGLNGVAGIAGFIGIVLLYRGLSRGAMAIFAPISAVTAALIPLVVGLLSQKTPSALPLIGAVCAILAIGLVSMSGSTGTAAVTPSLIGLALGSGVMFGIVFVILGQAKPDVGMWPLLGVRLGSIVLGLIVAAITRTSLRIGPAQVRWTAVAGSFDVGANALFILAAARGQLSIVAPISALYPVSTVLLALGVDREHVRVVQLAGLGLAAAALVLVAT